MTLKLKRRGSTVRVKSGRTYLAKAQELSRRPGPARHARASPALPVRVALMFGHETTHAGVPQKGIVTDESHLLSVGTPGAGRDQERL